MYKDELPHWLLVALTALDQSIYYYHIAVRFLVIAARLLPEYIIVNRIILYRILKQFGGMYKQLEP